jgi:hypothetical protein
VRRDGLDDAAFDFHDLEIPGDKVMNVWVNQSAAYDVEPLIVHGMF